MRLEGLVAELDAFEQFFLHVRLAGGGQEGRQKVLARRDVVDYAAWLDRAGPLHDHGDAESALEGRALLAPERGVAAVGPTQRFRAVTAVEDHDRVVGDP